MFLPMFGGLFLTEPLFKATWALCVYPEKCVQRRRTATDVILSPPCFARWHAHTATDVPVCTAVCQCEEGKHKQKSLSSLLCLEAFLLSGWVSFDLLDMMMEKKKRKETGLWAPGTQPLPSHNYLEIFFLALMVGEKRVLTCKHARQGRTVFIPLVSWHAATCVTALILYPVWWDGKTTAACASGRCLRDVALTCTLAVNTDRLLMSTSAIHMDGPEGTV